ncbi:MAG TPA: response regulator [Chthoniobacteraceae bacterium]
MSSSRILLVQNDPTLATSNGEVLAASGFAVEHAADGETALARLNKESFDAVVLDLILPTTASGEVIRNIRQFERSKDLPIIALPCSLAGHTRAALQAGATKALARDGDVPTELRNAVCEVTRHDVPNGPYRVNEALVNRIIETTPHWLSLLRRNLHAVIHNQEDRRALRELLQDAHHLTEGMALARVEGVFELASALTVFAGDLHKLPEQLNPSTLRTFGQAADFLATMLDDLHRGRTRAIDTARVLIVEDDAAAGQMIQAAMQFVGLRSVWADSPATSLDRLARESFDLIFLDVGLPQMSGFDLCSKVRTLELHEKTPVVFLTGMATFQNRVQSSLSGGNDFVGKPFNLPELGVKALIWVFKGHLGLT